MVGKPMNDESNDTENHGKVVSPTMCKEVTI